MKSILDKYKEQNIALAFKNEHTEEHCNDELPFHCTSVGKLFTTTLLLQAIDEKLLSFDSTLDSYFSASPLFTYKSEDVLSKITIFHLCTHTSGLPDYFEDMGKHNKRMLDELLLHPNKQWTMDSLLVFCMREYRIGFEPGSTYHYSDLNFLLLGIILEKIYQTSINTLLQNKICIPLQLHNTYYYYDKGHKVKEEELSPLLYKGLNIIDYPSLSSDVTGGGMITTTKDLLVFIEAFYTHKLFHSIHSSYLMNCIHTFHRGIYYGLGSMKLDFKHFFPLLFPLPSLYGHIGLSSCFAFYEPISKTSIVLNIGDTERMEEGIKILISLLLKLKYNRKH